MLTRLVVPILVVLHPARLFILVKSRFLECQKAAYCLTSCESEYRALATTAVELLWVMHLLHDLKIPILQQPLLSCDNKSSIFFSSNPVSHKRAKHVELDYDFLRELVIARKLRTQYVPSHLQVADIFTKSISRPFFEFSDPSFTFVQIRRSACGGC